MKDDNAQQARILVVDDSLPNLHLLTIMLTSRGYQVQSTSTGAEAIKVAETDSFDLILLDIMMTEMDGYEVCETLKANEKTRNIPIIFMSALNKTADKVSALTVGGVDYITKPFQTEEVLARVKTHVSLGNMQKQLQEVNGRLSEANEALVKANVSLEESNTELMAFARTVAHGLENPLGVILGYSELLLLEDNFTPTSTDYLNILNRTAFKMKDIIYELLLLAKLRETDIISRPLDMNKIVIAAQERLSDMINKYQAKIEVPSDWPVIIGYAPWVEEVWVNYLSNGMKYGGRPPQLHLGATLPAEDNGIKDGTVQFWVRDNGHGLSLSEQGQLFTPFRRVTQRQVEGHGLGLSIVRRITRKLNGRAGVESEVGQGSKFHFTLPTPARDYRSLKNL